ncbi:MAG: class I SAM-dependent methyltransferase [Acidobacteria bacterium]|nr:class I SAM-dependent methyltransferase [Acidobacteriota bacterium]
MVALRKFCCFIGLFLLLWTSAGMAQLGSRSTQEWVDVLDRPQRLESLKVEEIVKSLELKPGDHVADIGAGTGTFSIPMAKAVGASGLIYAVDIDTGLLAHINERASQEKITNVRTVAGEFNDPKLPQRDVDLAFFHDVLHHIENREPYLTHLASYLKPTGRIVVIDFVKDHPKAPHKGNEQLQVSLEQAAQWMKKIGFELVQQIPLFEEKYFVVFARR